MIKKKKNKSERLKTRLYYIHFLIVNDVLINRQFDSTSKVRSTYSSSSSKELLHFLRRHLHRRRHRLLHRHLHRRRRHLHHYHLHLHLFRLFRFRFFRFRLLRSFRSRFLFLHFLLHSLQHLLRLLCSHRLRLHHSRYHFSSLFRQLFFCSLFFCSLFFCR